MASDDAALRIPEDVLTAQLAGEAVVLHLKTKRYYRLNATGAEIWKGLEQGRTPDEVAVSLVDHFTVDLETARAEVHRLVADLRAAQLLD